jgi:outer membrane protein OmpA-like peptidoglycan-associated protein
MKSNWRVQTLLCTLMTSAAVLSVAAKAQGLAHVPSHDGLLVVAQATHEPATTDTTNGTAATAADPHKPKVKPAKPPAPPVTAKKLPPPPPPAATVVVPVKPAAKIAKPVVAPIAKPVTPVLKPVAKPIIKQVTPPTAPVVKNAAPAVVKQAAPTPPAAGVAPHVISDPINPPQVNQSPAAAAAAAAANAHVAKPEAVNLQQIQAARKQKTEAGGKRVVITEPDKRVIIKQNNQTIIQHDENARFRAAPNARLQRGKLGQQVSILDRPNGAQVISETDRNGNLIRRYRRAPDGKETVIIDNRKRDKFGRNLAIGLGIGVGVVAGAAILNEVINLPPPRVDIPRDKYIVRYEDATEDDVYEAFNAPPVDTIERRYSLDQVRASPYLRDRMRRVDLDDVNFETGSWEVDPSEYRKLERVARAMMRVIEHSDNEVFLIEGYTDAVGPSDDNLTLSDRRAEAVAEVLTREFNVPPENLTTQGYGEQYLKIETDGPERANRRVAIRRITPLIAQDEPAPPSRWRGDRDGNRDSDPYEDRERDRNRY